MGRGVDLRTKAKQLNEGHMKLAEKTDKKKGIPDQKIPEKTHRKLEHQESQTTQDSTGEDDPQAQTKAGKGANGLRHRNTGGGKRATPGEVWSSKKKGREALENSTVNKPRAQRGTLSGKPRGQTGRERN